MPFADYLTSMIAPLLKEPQSLRVVTTQDQLGVLLSVDVSKGDMGIVVGKEGATAKALRQLMRTFGMLHNARVSLKVNEPEGSQFRREIIR